MAVRIFSLTRVFILCAPRLLTDFSMRQEEGESDPASNKKIFYSNELSKTCDVRNIVSSFRSEKFRVILGGEVEAFSHRFESVRQRISVAFDCRVSTKF